MGTLPLPKAPVVAIIPALDEEAAIGQVVSQAKELVALTIVVDNGSRDRTAERALAAGAHVVSEPTRGYGQACLAGLRAAAPEAVVVFLDGDLSDDPRQIPEVVAPILADQADLVIGSRVLGHAEPGSHPWHAVAGTRVCVGLMNLLVGTRATDLGPFRAIRMSALRRLGLTDGNYGWTVEMQIKARQAGLRVAEVPVTYRKRVGRSKVSGTVKGTLGAAFKILLTILRHARLRGRRP